MADQPASRSVKKPRRKSRPAAPEEEPMYYVHIDDQTKGPVDGRKLRQLAHADKLLPTHHVCKVGNQVWTDACKMEGLFSDEQLRAAGVVDLQGNIKSLGELKAAQEVVYPTFRCRGLGLFIDWLVIVTVIGIVGVLLMGAFTGFSFVADDYETLYRAIGLAGAFGVLFYLLYFAVLESGAKQGSVGKQMLGMRVIDRDGRRLTFGRALGRTVVKLIGTSLFGATYWVALGNPQRRTLHDMAMETSVIRP